MIGSIIVGIIAVTGMAIMVGLGIWAIFFSN